jgi:SnoaL-like polyketide cyclase
MKRGHHRGEFMSVALAGKELEMSGFVICRVVGGKIVEERSESTAILETTRQRLDQERIERERRAGTQGGPNHPANLTVEGGAPNRGLADLSLLPAS